MVVRIAQEDLPGAVGPRFTRCEWRADVLEVLFPGAEIVDAQGEMVFLMTGEESRTVIGDEMQFLVLAEAKPGAGKGKRGPRDRFEAKHVTIKCNAGFDVLDVDGDVIEFPNGEMFRPVLVPHKFV